MPEFLYDYSKSQLTELFILYLGSFHEFVTSQFGEIFLLMASFFPRASDVTVCKTFQLVA
jgi:hypothetical protein